VLILRCFNRGIHPVVLSSRDRSHAGKLGDDSVDRQGRRPSNDEAVDGTRRSSIFERLAEKGEYRLPGNQLADRETKEREEGETPLEDLFLSENCQHGIVWSVRAHVVGHDAAVSFVWAGRCFFDVVRSGVM